MSASLAAPPQTRIHPFGGGSHGDVLNEQILGGKGYSLAMMCKAGLPVPPGFTLSTECCRIFHTQQSWPDGLAAEVDNALAVLEAKTNTRFGTGPRPLLLAVRSGAAVSMPGMMDSVLNVGLSPSLHDSVPGFWEKFRDFVIHFGEIVAGIPEQDFHTVQDATLDAETQALRYLEVYRAAKGCDFPTNPRTQLHAAIEAVFHSWNSERAQHYRARNDVRNVTGTAVNIQCMCPSELSGVLFTEDPNQPDARRILIEGSTGLGEALVLGRIEPDVFIVDRATLAISERSLSPAAAHLTDTQVIELAQLGLRVEKYFGFPVDIEWGYSQGAFMLLQSRRIRGLDIGLDVPIARCDEIQRLTTLATGRKRAWALHNLGETLPAPTPLTWDIIGGFMNRGGFIQLYKQLGFSPSARVERDGFLELIGGKIYACSERAAELFFDDYPLDYDLSEGRAEPLIGPPSRFNFERAGAGFLLKLPWFLFKMMRSGRILRRLSERCIEDFESTHLPRFLTFAANARATDLRKLSDSELLAELQERERIALNNFGAETLKPGFLAAYFHGRLAQRFQLIFGAEEGSATLARLLRGLDGDKTVEINIALYEIARGNSTLDTFLQTFGHRGVNEFELSERRWRQDDSYLQQILANYRRTGGSDVSPKELHEKQKLERDTTEQQLGALLRENGASSLEGEIRTELKLVQRYLPYRETGKHFFIQAVSLLRDVLEEYAERHDLGRDTYFLHRTELADFPTRKDELKKAIAQRKVRWNAFQRLEMPEVIFSDNLDALGRPYSTALNGLGNDGILSGVGVSAGLGTGTARVVRSPAEAGDLGTGYVLVCPTTDPSWTPLFVHAKGVVVERGGVLSHGAIVARDFGIPAVVVKNASKLIPHGASVRVDGNKGRVELLKA